MYVLCIIHEDLLSIMTSLAENVFSPMCLVRIPLLLIQILATKKLPHPSTHLSTLPSLSKHQRDGTINSKLFTQTNKLCQITSFLFHLHEGYQSEKFLIHYFLIGPGVYCDLLYIVNKWIWNWEDDIQIILRKFSSHNCK